MTEALSRLPDWAKYLIAVALTSALWTSIGHITASSSAANQRLDNIDGQLARLNDKIETVSSTVRVALNEGVTVNARQAEQITSMDHRVIELERGRESNREAIATLNARLAGQESAAAQAAKAATEVRDELRQHIIDTGRRTTKGSEP